MAMSNWDSMAFDNEGKPCLAEWKFNPNNNGDVISIYKNWVHFMFNGVGISINRGDIITASHSSVRIIAKRHPLQNSIFMVAEVGEYGKTQYFSGIGCYGFMDELDWLKIHHSEEYKKIPAEWVDPNNENIFVAHLYINKDDTFIYEFNNSQTNEKFEFEAPNPTLEDLWEGVTEETAKEFLKWLESLPTCEEYSKKIDLENALRYNQGDAFVAAASQTEIKSPEDWENVPTNPGNISDCNPTPIGESNAPIISNLI